MRKPIKKLPTRIIKPPKKDVIGGKTTVFYSTDAGEFTLRALHERLEEHGVKINIITLYDRILRDWSAAHNLNARHAGITTRLLPAKRPLARNTSIAGLSAKQRSEKLNNIKIGSWDRKQLQNEAQP